MRTCPVVGAVADDILTVVVADFNADVDTEVQATVVSTLFPSTAITPADTRVIVVSVACHTFTPANCGLSLVQSPMRAGIAVTLSSSISPVPAVLRPRIRFVFMSTIPASGKSIQFVRVQEAGVPRAGATKVLLLIVCVAVVPTTC